MFHTFKSRRDRLEIVAFEPDLLTFESGTIRTHLIIHNPTTIDNSITACEVLVRDAFGEHRLVATLPEKHLPHLLTTKLELESSTFNPEDLCRECVLQTGFTDAYGRFYEFRQPFINVESKL